ncbi:thymidine kinase [Neobacillus rhizosphaerae]|uniref:thymidine kinase n=1 Tax=Neobacillus rhizosphaerae TaxID=2880965 RepID=UPI003D2991A2
MSKAGKLTVIVGSMFSGKSTELQRQGRRKELAGELVAYFKPRKDNRYTPTAISTHDGTKVAAYVVEDAQSIREVLKQVEQQVGLVGTVCIDEIQFFDEKIVAVVNLLLWDGIDVVCSGLDLDRFAQPFGKVPELLCMAEEVVKVRAVCHSCGEDAWVSAGTFISEEQIVVGESDKYVPLCRTCYFKKGGII